MNESYSWKTLLKSQECYSWKTLLNFILDCSTHLTPPSTQKKKRSPYTYQEFLKANKQKPCLEAKFNFVYKPSKTIAPSYAGDKLK